MSEQTQAQATAPMYNGYPPNRTPYTSSFYQGYTASGKSRISKSLETHSDSFQAANIGAQNALNNMSNLKASLPVSTQASSEGNVDNRPGYNNPLMVLPSGQTVPLNSFYNQQNAASDSSAQMQFVPTGMYPAFMGNTGLPTSTLSNYTWPYGMAPNMAGMDTTRRPSYSSNDENGAPAHAVNQAVGQDYYTSMPFMPVNAAQTQHYVAGPIQPMKCPDNKSYEMVNLDELVSRESAIPRAVPALWTNQEELSLAKCLQNPEGITNVYIRGFMPDTTDEDLEHWASRFGEIESCKAIIEQDTGKCKG